jgi:hypothetical protein
MHGLCFSIRLLKQYNCDLAPIAAASLQRSGRIQQIAGIAIAGEPMPFAPDSSRHFDRLSVTIKLL